LFLLLVLEQLHLLLLELLSSLLRCLLFEECFLLLLQ